MGGTRRSSLPTNYHSSSQSKNSESYEYTGDAPSALSLYETVQEAGEGVHVLNEVPKLRVYIQHSCWRAMTLGLGFNVGLSFQSERF